LIALQVTGVAAGGSGNADGALRIRTSGATGSTSFVTSIDGKAITLPQVDRLKTVPAREAQPIDFLRAYAHLFGITDADKQLAFDKAYTDALGHTHTTFQQMHEGVPVFAGLLRVHFNTQGEPIAANGTFTPDIKLNTMPLLTRDEASEIALAEVARLFDRASGLRAVRSTLYVFRANLAKGVPGPNHLVYEVEVGDGASVREFLYVDAHTGQIVDQITGIHEAIKRRVYNGGFGNGFLVWSEGDSVPYGDVDVDHLIDYSQDTYNLVASATDGTFLSWDGFDGIMHSVNNDPTIDCPNANWNGISTNYCTGVTGDDTVAHEWGHAYTDSTHNLIYQWQPGALNESYSDIIGEVVDLLNGAGLDAPAPLRADAECSVFGGTPPPLCEVNSPPSIAGIYPTGGAAFNPLPPLTVTADVELVDDGDDEGGSAGVTDACQGLIGFTPGNIALVDRGTCDFLTKVGNATAAGAVGMIVVNSLGDNVFTMCCHDTSITIPSVMIGLSDGEAIKGELPGVNAAITLAASVDPSLRWLSGEDDPGFGGAIRDMWNPNCFRDPGKVSDIAHYWCGTGDSGGVHTNSGVPNHAFALLVDGGVYNGETITGIGLTKALHIHWRAQTVYQVPATYFPDHADALEQSCVDLIGVNLPALSTEVPAGPPSGEIIAADDCAELVRAINAVELRAEPVQCNFSPMFDPEAPPLCNGPGTLRRILFEDWEAGIDIWSVGTRAIANPATFDTPDWAVVDGLPDGRPGSAAFVADLAIGNCVADTEAGVLFLRSRPISVPLTADLLRVAFDHWVATELLWDGGNIKISVSDAPWQLVGSAQFDFNAYPESLAVFNDNPMAGEEAFTGSDGGEVGGSWGQSQLNLAGMVLPGDDIRLGFEMGLDGCNGVHGWYLDDVNVYYCCDTFGDVECDGDLDLDDYAALADCLSGPNVTPNPSPVTTASTCLDSFDSDADADIDLSDFATLQRVFGAH
jgi:Zn-dependent metalloprotease